MAADSRVQRCLLAEFERSPAPTVKEADLLRASGRQQAQSLRSLPRHRPPDLGQQGSQGAAVVVQNGEHAGRQAAQQQLQQRQT